jgi:hypothetical protein
MNIGIIIVIVVAGIWALGVFLGVIGGISKPFWHNSAVLDSSSIKSEEQKTIEDTQDKQQKLMEDMKQKMRDMSDKSSRNF